MAPGLCGLERLTSLTLCPSTESSLCGSIEHAPSLKRLKLTSTSQGSLLHSKTLTSLTIGSHNVSSPSPHRLQPLRFKLPQPRTGLERQHQVVSEEQPVC